MKKVLIGLIIVLIAESVLTGLIPHSRGMLFHYLEAKSGPIYIVLAMYFCNYLFLDFFQSVKDYVILKLSLIFRKKRTKEVLVSLKDDIEADNVNQRIQEDIKLSYVNRFKVWSEYFISGTIVVQLLLINLSEPVLILAALGYAIVSVFIAYKFNPRLTKVEKSVQSKEASFRQCMSSKGLMLANDSSLRAGKVRMHYLLFTKLQLGLVTILPYIVLIPSLLSGVIDLGTLVKHQATFALIVVNAAILIQFYTVLIQGKASEERVREIT